MKSETDFKKDLIIITYSSVLITTTYLFLLKISPLIFSLLCFFPLICISIITNNKQTLASFIISIICICLAFKFPGNIDRSNISFLISNIIFIFGFSYLLIILLDLDKNKNFGEKLSLYVLITSLIFIALYFSYLSNTINNLIMEIKEEYIASTVPQNKFIVKELNTLFEGITKIFPSINYIYHLFIIIGNVFIAKRLLKKFNFDLKKNLNFSNFLIPNWFLIIYLFFFFVIFLLQGELEKFILNVIISLSCIFLLSGIYIFKKFIEKINQPLFLKILILFLLFIFLGYVLILSLFFLGLINKIKHFFKEKFG